MNCSTAKWQVKFDSIKNDEVIDFLTWPPTDFLALMFKLQQQFNNIVETSQTTQLTND